jgi:uncharacterized protein
VVSARLAVRLTPRGGLDELEPPGPDGELRARVRAAPVDGAANEALLRLLARSLRVPRSSLRLLAGGQSRRKLVEVDGITDAEARSRLGGP